MGRPASCVPAGWVGLAAPDSLVGPATSGAAVEISGAPAEASGVAVERCTCVGITIPASEASRETTAASVVAFGPAAAAGSGEVAPTSVGAGGATSVVRAICEASPGPPLEGGACRSSSASGEYVEVSAASPEMASTCRATAPLSDVLSTAAELLGTSVSAPSLGIRSAALSAPAAMRFDARRWRPAIVAGIAGWRVYRRCPVDCGIAELRRMSFLVAGPGGVAFYGTRTRGCTWWRWRRWEPRVRCRSMVPRQPV